MTAAERKALAEAASFEPRMSSKPRVERGAPSYGMGREGLR